MVVSVRGAINATRSLRGRTMAEAIDFDVLIDPHEHVVSSGGTTEVTVDDVIYDEHSGATTQTNGHLLFLPTVPQQTIPQYTNLTPTICNLVDNHVDWVADGLARIKCRGRYGSREATIQVSQVGGQTTRVFNRFKNNTFAKVVSDTVDTALVEGKDQNYFSTQNHTTKTYVVNTNWFGYGLVDLTFKSVWNDARPPGYQDWQPSLLITPKHAIITNHYQPPKGVGTTDRYVALDGTVHERTIVARSNLIGNDTRIVTYDSDLPASISPAYILESAWRDHFGYTHGLIGAYYRMAPVLVLVSDQDNKVTIWETLYTSTPTYDSNQFTNPTVNGREDWNYPSGTTFVVGDSGSPEFFRYSDGKSILWTGVSTGDDWSQHLSTINAFTGAGYQITALNLDHLEMFVVP